MKIYTKGGDGGETSLWGGRRVSKANLQVQAYGEVDELNSFIGWLSSSADVQQHRHRQKLTVIQSHLFSVGAMLAQDTDRDRQRSDFILSPDSADSLENAIDDLESELPTLTQFILPGGSDAAARAHICRTVCRRAERAVVLLALEMPVDPAIVRYLNRLSDYLFVLARHLCHSGGNAEITWEPDQ